MLESSLKPIKTMKRKIFSSLVNLNGGIVKSFFNGKITKYDTESSCLMSVMHQQACRAGLLFPNFVNGENKMVGNLIKLTFKNISSNISSNAK